ncbi:MAG TPA: manganese transporter [Phycisphaerales bacterium]|nr:manganese transporter [Phycisphaerales bacterium]
MSGPLVLSAGAGGGAGAWERLGEVLSFRAGYNTTVVLVGVLMLGIAGGVVGALALLRKRSLVADALSHATLPGVGLGFIVASSLGAGGKNVSVLLTGAAVTGALGVLCVQAIARWSRLAQDAAIAIVLSVFFGAGVVILSVVQGMSAGNQGGLKAFIYGQTAAMSVGDAALMGAIALLSAGAAVLLLKEFAVVAFDEGFARATGWPVMALDLAGMALIVLVTVAGLQAVGLLLIVAILIVPPAAARFWTDRVGGLVLLSAVLGGASGLLGAGASAVLPGKPTGAVIVLVAGGLFLLSMLLAPRRGLLAAGLRRARLRWRVIEDHALRAMLEHTDTHGGARVPRGALARACGWGGSLASWPLRVLIARGLLRREGGDMALTPAGAARAAAVTRNHRLWERYLIERADIAPSHVDFSADLVEHVLSPSIVAALENALRAEGRLPSPHPLSAVEESGARR